MEIRGSVAMVVGGASGLGEAAVHRLAEEGAKVLVADLDAARVSAVAADVAGVPVVVDVTDEAPVEHAAGCA